MFIVQTGTNKAKPFRNQAYSDGFAGKQERIRPNRSENGFV